MQAIETKFIPPTNSKGARIKAQCAAKAITIGYPYEFDGEKAHRYAANELCEIMGGKFGWNFSQFVSGQLKNGNYVHVNIMG